MSYTSLVLVGLAVTLVLDAVLLRTRLLLTARFWSAYAVVLVFQLLVNGVLTGRRVVTYAGGAPSPFIGQGRFCFAPWQDLLFGFALVTQTLCWWVWWGARASPRPGQPGPAVPPDPR
jgi:lycopene cyclase domain-containing protein